MATYLWDALIVVMGSLFAIFHARIGRNTAEFGYNVWHWSIYRNRLYVRALQVGFLLIGIFFTIMGMLWLLFPSHFKFS